MEAKKDSVFVVRGLGGKKKLRGSIRVGGAKNIALKVLAASLLFEGKVELKNVPDIEDVHRMADLLQEIGVRVEQRDDAFVLHPPKDIKNTLPSRIAERLRASIVLTGPILTRTGRVSFPHPGGCVIGERPIDLFLESFKKMGARAVKSKDRYILRAPQKGLQATSIVLTSQSVTATETILMAALLANGTTTIENAAVEPEVKELAQFLNENGADIQGAGTHTITIKGRKKLLKQKKAFKIPPDRIETGSFLIMGALCCEDLMITHCEPKDLTLPIALLESAGVPLSVGNDFIKITRNKKPNHFFTGVHIKTHEYPGFPTDLQAPMVVFLSQASGESLVFETIFTGRLLYVEELARMGASITTMDPHRVIVHGPQQLSGREMESPDLRAGLAFVIAALVAKGDSIIHNVYNIDRGYWNIEKRLSDIGADISRM